MNINKNKKLIIEEENEEKEVENDFVSDMLELKEIIDNNNYIKNCISNKNKDYNSLSYLINRDLSQSDCIKLENGIEKIIQEIIIKKNKNLINIKPKNKKGQKEKDHLFKDENNKIIYYAEIKSNLNLDTEKCRATYDKCLKILNELENEYNGYKINMFLIGIRYYDKKIIPKVILNKYLQIIENVLGINNYLEIMNTNIYFINEEKYKEFLNYIANKMFD